MVGFPVLFFFFFPLIGKKACGGDIYDLKALRTALIPAPLILLNPQP